MIPRVNLPLILRNARSFMFTSRSLNSTILKSSSTANNDQNDENTIKMSMESNEAILTSTPEVVDDSITNQLLILNDTFSATRGKKRKPDKANIVVLDPKQAGLLKKRRTPDYFRRRQDGERLSVLEGVELGILPDRRQVADIKRRTGTSVGILNEIESQRKKLLVFKSSVSREQAVRSISYQKPSESIVSRERYEQLEQLLDSAYTLPQLRAYTRDYYKAPNSRSTKPNIIRRILDKYWNCVVNETINESEDLIVERVIDISTRDMYLLLLTSNGKILNNFARIGATLAVAIDENVVIVRATAPIIKYVEVSLNRILANVDTTKLPVHDIIINHTAKGTSPNTSEGELVSMVQKESAAYFEKTSTDGEDDGCYQVSAFGSKRLLKAKNLLLWGVNYHPQLQEEVEICYDQTTDSFKSFPFTNIECLDWVKRNKGWYRLQQPLSKNGTKDTDTQLSTLLQNEHKLDEWYNFLVQKNESSRQSNMMHLKGVKETSVFSLTLGQILTTNENSQTKETLFEPKITQIASKLLELPLYDLTASKDEHYTVDQHEYYVQLKFIPDLSTLPDGSKNAPPLELWFELDDYDSAVTSTARCIVQQEQRALLLQTPNLPHDYRINNDRMVELTETAEEAQEQWLSEQPGVKKFIQDAQLTFSSRKKLKVPKSLDLNLTTIGDGPEVTHCNVQYDYVNANYHRVLRLMYMDKYMVQFSDVKGGSLGGRYTQVDFIGGEVLNCDEFKQFIKDVAQSF